MTSCPSEIAIARFNVLFQILKSMHEDLKYLGTELLDLTYAIFACLVMCYLALPPQGKTYLTLG